MSTLVNPTANNASRIFEKHVRVLGNVTCRNLYTENEWKTYTPTVAGGGFATTRTINVWKYRIVGSTLHIQANQANTDATGATSTGAYTFTLPTGCVLAASLDSMCGGAAILRTVASGKIYTGSSFVSATGTAPKLSLMLGNEATTPAQWGNASPHATDTNLNFAGGLVYTFSFSVELDPTSPVLLTQNT